MTTTTEGTTNDGTTGAGVDGGAEVNPEVLAQSHLGFQRLEAEIRAVSQQELEPINIDVPSTVATVLGALPEIRALGSIIASLPVFDRGRFEKLHDYALALAHTHTLYRSAAGIVDNIGDLASEGIALRDRLHADATALANRGVLDAMRVAKLKSGNAYKNVAFDVMGLVELFLERWTAIGGRTAVQREELESARLTANRLLNAIGLREQAPAAVGAAAMLRQQAFTLLVHAYDEVRRAVKFVRWHHDDAETIAPSLYAGRGTRRSQEDTPVAPEVPSFGAPHAASPPNTVNAPNAPVGLPGSSPFTRS